MSKCLYLLAGFASLILFSTPVHSSPDADCLAGKLARIQGTTTEAELYLQKSLLDDCPEARLELALLRLEQGRSNDAFQLLLEALEYPDTAVDAALYLSGEYLQNERHDEAVTVLRRTLVTQPGAMELRQRLVEALLVSGRAHEAAIAVEELMDAEPERVEWLELQLVALHQAGQITEARSVVQKLRRLDPGNTGYTLVEASHLFALGRLKECERLLTVLARKHPDLPEVHLQRGILCETMGDRVAAERFYRRYLDALPEGDRDSAIRDLAKLLQETSVNRRIIE